jgi:hypothetical protein
MSNYIICGFSGVGKSTAEQKHKNVIDFESSGYSHIFKAGEPYAKDPSFPGNYIDAVCDHMDKTANTVYLLSCHEEVRNELKSRGIPYFIVMPEFCQKEEYLRRWLKRGSSVEFIEIMNDRWVDMIQSCERDAAPKIHLNEGEYIDDVLPV